MPMRDSEASNEEGGQVARDGTTGNVYRALGRLSGSQWQKVADRFELGQVERATSFAGGFGNNVELLTDTGSWVFSGKLTLEEAERERFFLERIAGASPVAVPWPYFIDASEEIFDWTYAVMRHVGGEFITWNQPHDWTAIAHALGRAAADLHAVTFPAPGQWQNGDLVTFGGTQQERFESLVAEFISRASRQGLLDAKSERWVREAVAEARVEGYIPTLVHHDLTRNNAHFVFNDGTAEVTGIFDFKECLVGDPDEDLARSLWEFGAEASLGAAQAFLDAYRAQRPARAGEAARLRAYVIYDLLLIWVGAESRDHAETPHSGFGGHETFRAWASRIVEPVEQVLAHR